LTKRSEGNNNSGFWKSDKKCNKRLVAREKYQAISDRQQVERRQKHDDQMSEYRNDVSIIELPKTKWDMKKPLPEHVMISENGTARIHKATVFTLSETDKIIELIK